MGRPKKTPGITITYLAAQLNVSDNAVLQAIRRGDISHEWNAVTKKIDENSIKNNEWVISQIDIKNRTGRSNQDAIEKLNQKIEIIENVKTDFSAADFNIHPGMTIQAAMIANEILDAALKKTKLDEAQGILIKKEMVQHVLFNLGSELRKELFNIPKRIVLQIMACQNEVEAMNIFNNELKYVLDNYGKLKSNSFEKV